MFMPEIVFVLEKLGVPDTTFRNIFLFAILPSLIRDDQCGEGRIEKSKLLNRRAGIFFLKNFVQEERFLTVY